MSKRKTSKRKLLVWCDFLVQTGFGRVAHELLDEAHKQYDVDVVGINADEDTEYDTSKYTVHAANKKNLGATQLVNLAKEKQPDIIFLFQDIFHISELIEQIHAASPKSKIVVYFPTDGGPLSIMWFNVFIYADHIILYTEWSKKMVENTYPPSGKPMDILYHGINPKAFYPLKISKIKELRAAEGWSDKFVVVNVNRFQPRKAIPLSIRSFSMFAKGYNECNECGHRQPVNVSLCELCTSEDISINVKKKENVLLYLHMMPVEFSMGFQPYNSLNNHLLNAGFQDSDLGTMLDVNTLNIYKDEIPESRVNEFYNMANVNISSTLGEGCGLSLLESAATGTESIAPKNSAIPEMLGEFGHQVRNAGVVNLPLDSSFIRPVVDEWAVVEALEIEYAKWTQQKEEVTINTKCIDRIHKDFLWEDKRDKLYAIFERVLTTTK